jgi:hypothetical protein
MKVANSWTRILFYIASLYDGLLGVAFLLFGREIYAFAGVAPPNHFGYVKFPALLLTIFGVMFFRIAQDVSRNRELILYGIALKASYIGVVFWYQTHGGLPGLWLPWAWADLIFLVLFVVAWRQSASR